HTICYRDWSSDVCSSDLAQPGQPGAQKGNQWGRSQRNHHVVAWQERQPQSTGKYEGGEVSRAPPSSAFAEPSGANPINMNSAPEIGRASRRETTEGETRA